MAVYNGYQLFGIGIQTANTRFQSLGIETGNTRLQGITLNAGNFFNESIIVNDIEGNAISGATVEIVSTQTHPNNYEGNITGITNSEGLIQATGSSTTGTTVTVSATGYQTTKVPLNSLDYIFNSFQTIILLEESTGGSSKKIYTTNKGNILINPNDTILIELD